MAATGSYVSVRKRQTNDGYTDAVRRVDTRLVELRREYGESDA